jgi:hypothetical protein
MAKLDQIVIKYTKIFHSKTLYPNRYFWLESKPSGNPGLEKGGKKNGVCGKEKAKRQNLLKLISAIAGIFSCAMMLTARATRCVCEKAAQDVAQSNPIQLIQSNERPREEGVSWCC